MSRSGNDVLRFPVGLRVDHLQRIGITVALKRDLNNLWRDLRQMVIVWGARLVN